MKQEENKQRQQQSTKIEVVKDENLTTLCYLAFFFFILLFSMEFLGKNFLWMYLGFAFFLAFTARYIRFRLEVIPLAVLSISVLLFSEDGMSITTLLRVLSYPLCYFVGSNLWVERDPERFTLKRQEKTTTSAIFVFALGSFIHFMLNFLYNLGGDATRNSLDFWSGLPRSATNQAALGVLAVGVAITVFFSNYGFWKKLLATAVLVLASFYALTLAGRTMFAILLLVSFVALFHMWLKGGRRSKVYRIVFLLLLLAAIAVVFVYFNVFGLKDMVKQSNFYNRFFGESEEGLEETGRWAQKAYYLSHFFENIFGGSHMLESSGEYAHDIFLDTYDQSGIFALLSIVVFLGMSVYQMLAFIKDKAFSFNMRQLVLCIHLVFAVEFLVEPILQGMPWLFCAFCFIQGAMANARHNAHNPRLRGIEE